MEFEIIEYETNQTKHQYEYFVKLIDLLKTKLDQDFGFWYNRNMILRLVKFLSIYLDKITSEIVAFSVIDEIGDIVFFQVFKPGQGIGTRIMEYELQNHPNLHVSYSLKEAAEFWEKMGIPYKVQ